MPSSTSGDDLPKALAPRGTPPDWDPTRRSGKRPQQSDLTPYLQMVRRWWYLPGTYCAVALGLAWWVLRTSPRTFTAEAMVQREVQASPLDAAVAEMNLRATREGTSSVIEIMTSPTVLGRVVDSLGLRIRLLDDRLQRTRVIADAEVAADATTGDYQLVSEAGDVRLVDDSDAVVARGASGGTVRGDWIRLTLGADAQLSEPIEVRILPAETAIKQLRRALRVDPILGTSLVKVSYASTDPEFSALLVNVVAGLYQSYMAEQARVLATRRREFLQGQLTQLSDSLSKEQDQLLTYQEESRTLDPDMEMQALASELIAAESQVRQLRFQESLLAGIVFAVSDERSDTAAYYGIAAVGSDLLPAGAGLYNRLRDLETQRTRLTSSRFGLTDSAVEVQQLDSLIAETKGEIRVVSEESLDVLRKRLSEAQSHASQLRTQVEAVPGRQTAFTRLAQRVQAVQDIFDMVVEKYYEAQIAEAVEVGDVQILSAAMVPTVPDPMHAMRTYSASLFLGITLGIASMLLLEFTGTAIKGVQEVELITALPVLAELPRLVRSNGNGRFILGPHERGAESFRVLRTNLAFANQRRPGALLVTSAGPGEGKTTIATNLAVSMAQDGASTLLVDADLRRPRLHEVLGVSRGPGLSDILRGDIEPNGGCLVAEGTRLVMIPAGQVVGHPAELLGSQEFARFIGWARAEFDCVVVDTPPVLVDADALVIGRAVDGALLVARSFQTHRDALGDAVEQLSRMGVPLVGAVVNDTHGVSDGRYYRYGYDRYYHGSNGTRKREGGDFSATFVAGLQDHRGIT